MLAHCKGLRNGRQSPRREWLDTVLLDPEESVEVAFVADNPGDWLFHCHIRRPGPCRVMCSAPGWASRPANVS